MWFLTYVLAKVTGSLGQVTSNAETIKVSLQIKGIENYLTAQDEANKKYQERRLVNINAYTENPVLVFEERLYL